MISCSRLSTISGGVPAGANRPFHIVTSYPGRPASAIVGTSGAAAVRVAPVTAMAVSLPIFTCCMTDDAGANMACVRPAITSVIPSIEPL